MWTGCSKLFTSWFLEMRLPGWLSCWDMLPLLVIPMVVPASRQDQTPHSHTGSLLALPPELLEELWSGAWKIGITLCNFPAWACSWHTQHPEMWATLSVTGQTPGARELLGCIWSWGWPFLKGQIGFDSGWESAFCWISVNCINCSGLCLALLYLETCVCSQTKILACEGWIFWLDLRRGRKRTGGTDQLGSFQHSQEIQNCFCCIPVPQCCVSQASCC